MAKHDFKPEIMQGIGALQERGAEWIFMSEIARHILLNDAGLMQRHQRVSSVLRFMRLRTTELPGKQCCKIAEATEELVDEGAIETRYENPEAHAEGLYTRQMFRLAHTGDHSGITQEKV